MSNIFLLDAQHGWAVGDHGTILVTSDGKSWIPENSGTENNLFGVHFVDAQHGWAVGAHGTILATSDGKSWVPENSGTENNLFGVHFVDAQHGWAVGAHGTILATSDGKSWVPENSGTENILFGVHFVDAQHGWAVGDHGTILATSDGKSWVPENSETGYGLGGVHFVDAQHGWAVGDHGTILATSDGKSWVPENSGTKNLLGGVHFVDAQHGWAVGDHGTILATSDGKSWVPENSGTENNLFGVHFVDAQHGWAVGPHGTILATSDGKSWVPENSGTENELEGVHFVDAQHGWAVGAYGTILATSDGKSWVPENSGTKNLLEGVHFVDAQHGWAVGDHGTILATSDGKSWVPENSGTENNLFGVHFVDAQHGWAVGAHGTILATSDGKSWVPENSGTENNLFGVHFVDAQHGWAVGAHGTILATSDGKSWVPENSGTENNFLGVHFVDAQHGWAVGDHGTILATSDGKSWVPENSETGYGLGGVHFVDAQHGWAVGDHGTILATSDGKSWVPKHSGTENNLFGVHFVDAQHGWAVGDQGTVVLPGERFGFPSLDKPEAPANSVGEVDLSFGIAGDHIAPIAAVSVQEQVGRGQPQSISTPATLPPVNGRWHCVWRPDDFGIGKNEPITYLVTINDGELEPPVLRTRFVFAPPPPLWQRLWDWLNQLEGRQLAGAAVSVGLAIWLLVLAGLYGFAPSRLTAWQERVPSPAALNDTTAIFNRITFGFASLLAWGFRLPLLFLGTSPRALDGWIRQRVPTATTLFAARPSVSDRRIALDLPVRIDAVSRPEAWSELRRRLFHGEPLVIVITGPGGAGKTTLACQIGLRSLGTPSQGPLAGHPALPLLIETDVADDITKPALLCRYLAGVLRSAVNEQRPISNGLMAALLRNGRVVVIVDGLSERSQATRLAFDPQTAGFEISRLVITSRDRDLPGRTMLIETETIPTGGLFDFITHYLAEMTGSEGGAVPFEDEVLHACGDLKRLLGSKPCTPLLAAMWAREIAASRQGSTTLPRGVAALMESYIRRLLAPAAQGNETLILRLIKDARHIAALELGDSYQPGYITRQAAMSLLERLDPVDAERRFGLLERSRLLESPAPDSDAVRIAPDPVAEHLVAHLRMEEFGANTAEWQKLLSHLRKHGPPQGFVGALDACADHAIYGKSIPLLIGSLIKSMADTGRNDQAAE